MHKLISYGKTENGLNTRDDKVHVFSLRPGVHGAIFAAVRACMSFFSHRENSHGNC